MKQVPPSLEMPPSRVAIATDAQVAAILGMKLPPELARMIDHEEPLPEGMGQGWKRSGLLHLPS